MRNKKKLGIIGGMGSRAGAFFLQRIIDYSPAESDQEFLEIIFHNNSLIPDRTKAIAYNETSPVQEILKSVELFNKNQVEVIALGCITAYYYYNQICAGTTATVLNPLYMVAEHISEEYAPGSRIGLLATTGTIRSGLVHKALEDCNVEIITLDKESQENCFMRSVYMKNGFKSAWISTEARTLMNKCIESLTRNEVDVIIAGCTEVSIAIEPGQIPIPIPYIDILDLMARKTVDYCYNLNHTLKTEYNG